MKRIFHQSTHLHGFKGTADHGKVTSQCFPGEESHTSGRTVPHKHPGRYGDRHLILPGTRAESGDAEQCRARRRNRTLRACAGWCHSDKRRLAATARSQSRLCWQKHRVPEHRSENIRIDKGSDQ